MTVNIDELAVKYQNLLKDEGYGCKDPVEDKAANTLDMVIKYEGMSFLLVLDRDDPAFVRIILPNFYTIKPEKINDALLAVHDTVKKCKGAKVYLSNNGDDSMAAAEFLENGTSVDAKLIIRYLSMVMNAAKVFAKQLEETS